MRQNPRFHAGMSGPVGGLFNNLQGEMSRRNEYSVFITDKRRQRILKKLFPQAVFRRFENDAFWRDPQLNFRGVRVV